MIAFLPGLKSCECRRHLRVNRLVDPRLGDALLDAIHGPGETLGSHDDTGLLGFPIGRRCLCLDDWRGRLPAAHQPRPNRTRHCTGCRTEDRTSTGLGQPALNALTTSESVLRAIDRAFSCSAARHRRNTAGAEQRQASPCGTSASHDTAGDLARDTYPRRNCGIARSFRRKILGIAALTECRIGSRRDLIGEAESHARCNRTHHIIGGAKRTLGQAGGLGTRSLEPRQAILKRFPLCGAEPFFQTRHSNPSYLRRLSSAMRSSSERSAKLIAAISSIPKAEKSIGVTGRLPGPCTMSR